MTIEQQKTSPEFREIEWVSKQVKEELKRFNKENFYEKNGEEIVYNMDTVKQYLGVLKEKKTRNELVSKNSSAMVMAVQIALYSQDYSFGTVDGILGERTKTAIRKFQADNNLPVDTLGRSMPSTIEKLLEMISKEDKVEIPEEDKKEAQEIIEEEKENKEDYEDNLNKIKTWAKNPRRESHNFRTLSTLTLAEAKAIHRDEERQQEIGYSYLLPLSGIKEVTPEIFEELLKHKGVLEIGIESLTQGLANEIVKYEEKTHIGENITFSGLTKIENSAYETLGKTKGILTFNALKTITPEEIRALTKNPGQRIYLNAIEQINPEIAEKISNSPRDIYLNGITNIDLDTARELSTKKTGEIHLEGLKGHLSSEILNELANMPREILKLKQDNEDGSIYREVNERRRQKEELKNNN